MPDCSLTWSRKCSSRKRFHEMQNTEENQLSWSVNRSFLTAGLTFMQKSSMLLLIWSFVGSEMLLFSRFNRFEANWWLASVQYNGKIWLQSFFIRRNRWTLWVADVFRIWTFWLFLLKRAFAALVLFNLFRDFTNFRCLDFYSFLQTCTAILRPSVLRRVMLLVLLRHVFFLAITLSFTLVSPAVRISVAQSVVIFEQRVLSVRLFLLVWFTFGSVKKKNNKI